MLKLKKEKHANIQKRGGVQGIRKKFLGGGWNKTGGTKKKKRGGGYR